MSRFILQKRFKRWLGVGRYSLRTDVDNASRMGNVKKHTYSWGYYPSWRNKGGDSGHNFIFHTQYRVATPIPHTTKPYPLHYARENIGIKNFKKENND